jgi:hypothetical protein
MPLARFDAPFEHPDWIFEPKLDGFRAVAYVEGGTCRLVSRNRNAFKTFEPLAQAIGQELSGRSAILDGEIVRPGPDGRPMFYELMRRAGHSASTHSICSGWTARTCGVWRCPGGKRCFGNCSHGRRTRFGMWSTWRAARTCSGWSATGTWKGLSRSR